MYDILLQVHDPGKPNIHWTKSVYYFVFFEIDLNLWFCMTWIKEQYWEKAKIRKSCIQSMDNITSNQKNITDLFSELLRTSKI
jgi:hypothetical protein